MEKTEELRILHELSESKGWALIQDKMSQEVVAAAFQLGANNGMTIDEIHFRRGAMWAAQKLMQLPETMTTMLENEIILSKDPATAESLSETRSLRPAPNKEV